MNYGCISVLPQTTFHKLGSPCPDYSQSSIPFPLSLLLQLNSFMAVIPLQNSISCRSRVVSFWHEWSWGTNSRPDFAARHDFTARLHLRETTSKKTVGPQPFNELPNSAIAYNVYRPKRSIAYYFCYKCKRMTTPNYLCGTSDSHQPWLTRMRSRVCKLLDICGWRCFRDQLI